MSKILIADDSWLTRKGIMSILAEDGYEFIESEDGPTTLDTILSSSELDCILLDLLMPEMDGFEVLENLNKKGLDIPVIIISADIQDTSRAKCFDMGAVGFVNKPPKREELRKLVKESLKMKKSYE